MLIAPALVGTIWSQLGGVVTGHVTGSFQPAVEAPYLALSWAAACRRVLVSRARQRLREPLPQ
jgi:hypothetical protein